MLDMAAKDVVMFNSGDAIIKDIRFIKERIASLPPGQKPRATLTWKPEKGEVSSSGDLGYTYGWHKQIVKDSTGKEIVKKGLYSTIWRKVDADWKLVMD
jgi:ketosteroid isomerase-like protein